MPVISVCDPDLELRGGGGGGVLPGMSAFLLSLPATVCSVSLGCYGKQAKCEICLHSLCYSCLMYIVIT